MSSFIVSNVSPWVTYPPFLFPLSVGSYWLTNGLVWDYVRSAKEGKGCGAVLRKEEYIKRCPVMFGLRECVITFRRILIVILGKQVPMGLG